MKIPSLLRVLPHLGSCDRQGIPMGQRVWLTIPVCAWAGSVLAKCHLKALIATKPIRRNREHDYDSILGVIFQHSRDVLRLWFHHSLPNSEFVVIILQVDKRVAYQTYAIRLLQN